MLTEPVLLEDTLNQCHGCYRTARPRDYVKWRRYILHSPFQIKQLEKHIGSFRQQEPEPSESEKKKQLQPLAHLA